MTQPSQTPAGDGSSSAAVSSTATPDVRDARRTWILGGSLLIANAVLVLAANGYPLQAIPGLSIVLNGLWAAALLVFAFGVRGRGSVVARRPLGVVALVIAALVPFASLALWAMLPVGGVDEAAAAMGSNGLYVLSLASLLVATVAIGRAGAVPYRLRWVPLIVLAVGAGVQVVAQLFLVSVQGSLVRPDITALVFGTAMLGTVGVLLLGILAIVFAPREPQRPAAPAQVYPPAS